MHFIQVEFIYFMATIFVTYWLVSLDRVVRPLGAVGGGVLRGLSKLVPALHAVFGAPGAGRFLDGVAAGGFIWFLFYQGLGLPDWVAGLSAGVATLLGLRFTPLGFATAPHNRDAMVEASGLAPFDGRVAQNILLAGASAFFYGYVHPAWLILLYFSAVLDYFVGRSMERDPENRRRYLYMSLAGNLGMLGLFKYYNFFVDNLKIALSEGVGITADFWMLDIILPVGISFYTFQTMSYTIDVYNGKLQSRRNFLDYLVYVSFFPQLVAGPIERAESLLPQVEKVRTLTTDKVLSGFGLALWGVFKKVCIADTLAPYVNEVYMTREPAFVMVLAAGFGFGVQMLADFSGYTDVARGTSRMLGIHLVKNFDRPYHAQTTPEFWRKWHISLSSWVGDYVYTPLLRTGKPSPARTIGAIMTTFFLIGLWHGASWNFIVLGLFNGFWMVVYTFGTPLVPRRIRNFWLAGGVAWFFHTFFVLQPTGLLFREVSLARVWQHLNQPWLGGSQEEWIAASIVASFALLGTLPMNISFWVEDHVLPRIKPSAWFLPICTTFWALEILAIFIFYRDASEDFIYFQF